MAMTLKGIRQVDGTDPNFNYDNLERGIIYFVRADATKEHGYLYLNGKKYGKIENLGGDIDSGVY